MESMVSFELDYNSKAICINLSFAAVGYILDDLPCRSDTWASVDDQLAMIKNLPVKPDFIINMRVKSRGTPIRQIQ